MSDRKSFYIIDGHAHIYRAYFAPFRDLTAPSGEPTKATFVFTQMLLNLVEQRKPDYLAMVIDEGGDEGVFRKAIYPQYKANRASRPDDFAPQEARILQIVRDAGVPIFGKPGFEADDLIATMTKNLQHKGFDVYLVSKDKDLRQLLDDATFMYDVQANEVIDSKKLEGKVGYGPRSAVEVQTLMGDAIDNVPGIPGIGEKTAAKLIAKYGTADAVLLHLDELTPKMRENFQTHAANIPLARQLVTLRTDVEFDFAAAQCEYKGLNTTALRSHLETLGFKNLLARIGGNGTDKRPPVVPVKPIYQPFGDSLFGNMDTPGEAPADTGLATSSGLKYELIDSEEKFDAFIAELKQQKRFAFDSETDDLGAMRSQLVGMSFSWKAGTGYYVPVKGPVGCALLDCDRVLKALKPVMEDAGFQKIGHNLKYDILVMRNAGIDVRGVVLDTMVAAFLIDASRMQFGVDRLAVDLLKFKKIPTVDLLGKGKAQISMDRVELRRVADYASEDADIALRLAEVLEPKLDELPSLRLLNDEVETPLIDVLVEMEFNGIAVDPNVLKEQSTVLGERIEKLRIQIHQEAGSEFNIDSPKQLEKILFIDLKLATGKKTKTGYSTDVQVLERLALSHPLPRLILDYRSLVKLKNTYLDNLTAYLSPRTGRIHTSFNQTGAATGRLSSSDPNLQNIPIRTDEGRRIRLAFVPGDPVNNVLLTADYSQIELRLLAHFTQEPGLLKAFKADEDIHKTVASEVFGVPLEAVTREQRGYAKTINFGIIYGVSAFGLSSRIDGLTVQAAKELIERYHARFPGISLFFKKCVAEAKSQGYVETILGRRRPIPDINSAIINMRNYAERAAINSVVQGSAADLIKVAMVNIHRRLADEQRPSKLLLQVHDELVFETPIATVEQEAEFVKGVMNAALSNKLSIPLRVDAGWAKNWQEVK